MPASGTATVTATGPGGSASAIVTIIKQLADDYLAQQRRCNSGEDAAVHFQWRNELSPQLYWHGEQHGALHRAHLQCRSTNSDKVTVTGHGRERRAHPSRFFLPRRQLLSAGSGGKTALGIFSATVNGRVLLTHRCPLNGSVLSTVYVSAGTLTISELRRSTGTGKPWW